MEEKIQFLLQLGAAAVFLAFLVWLMYREGSKPSWHEISSETKQKRNLREQKDF